MLQTGRLAGLTKEGALMKTDRIKTKTHIQTGTEVLTRLIVREVWGGAGRERELWERR